MAYREENGQVIPEWWANVQRVCALQGYIVIGSRMPLPCGYRVHGAMVPGSDGNHDRLFPQVFAVIGPATREEFIAQSKLVAWLEPDAPLWGHFYRAATD